MRKKTKLKSIVASAAFAAALFGPTVAVKDNTSAERHEISFPSITLEKNTAKARNYNLEGRLAVAGFDVLFNGLKCGIGASSRGDDFWPAFGKCAILGLGVFGGKEIASWNGYVPFSGGMGKLTHDLFVSMSDNITFGRGMAERFVTDFGPFEFHFDSRKGFDLYFHPYSAHAIVRNIQNGYKFDLKESLYNLTPVFLIEQSITTARNTKIHGITQQNVITYSKENEKISKSHEFNHVLFLSEFRFIDELMPNKGKLVTGTLSSLPEPLSGLFRNNPGLEYAIDHIRLGPWLAERLMIVLPSLDYRIYHYTPWELEAFTMERPLSPNSHPFYRHR